MKMDITPTPRGYAQMLLAILENAELGTKEGREARQWVRDEITRLIVGAATITPDAWGKER